MKFGYALITFTFISLWLSWPPAHAGQNDPVVIRGPVGSEQTDVREGAEQYGPVTRTDTLWSIASRVRPHSSVTLPQVMVAIVQANPHAFLDNNPNALESGFILRIPSLQEIRMINPEAARRQIELGEQIQQSTQQLQQTRQQTEQTDAQRVMLVDQTRAQTEQAITQVRDEYAEEFNELRQRLSRSIENTEAVIAANDELRERIDAINQTLDDIQRNMVADADFQQQVRELMEAQQSLRLEQETSREVQQSQGLAQSILNNPLALLLLAFVPALLLIIIATMVLRRKQVAPGANIEATAQPSAEEQSNATAASMVTAQEEGKDDFELDEAMAEFDDLDDEGDDLAALEDEMLVPDEDDDDSIQLDDDMDNMDLSEFDALDDDLSADFSASTEDEDSTSAGSDADSGSDAEEEDAKQGDQELSQSDLDALFEGGFDDEDDEQSHDEDTETPAAIADEGNNEADSPFAQPEQDELEEPEPGALFQEQESSTDDWSEDDTSTSDMPIAQDGETEAAEPESVEGLDDEEDFDFDRMMEQFADDEDDDLSDDDIESLLAKSDQIINQGDATAQPSADVTSDEDAQQDSSVDESDDTEDDSELDETSLDPEAEQLDAEEALDFDEEPVTEAVPEQSENEAITEPNDVVEEVESDDEFIDIDRILEEADSEPEDEEDEPQTEDSRRADAEDNLAAQLDLARAYLEMGEQDEARDTIEAVIEQADGELLEEAKALLARLDS